MICPQEVKCNEASLFKCYAFLEVLWNMYVKGSKCLNYVHNNIILFSVFSFLLSARDFTFIRENISGIHDTACSTKRSVTHITEYWLASQVKKYKYKSVLPTYFFLTWLVNLLFAIEYLASKLKKSKIVEKIT